MTTKYDWSDVPETIAYIATDSDGFVFGYKSKPDHVAKQFIGDVYVGFCLYPEDNPFKGIWTNSIEQRPGEPQ
ncbi:hypothetical protein F966_03632 [Acinetobacter higginsii]|uniref:Uncharacterized protein n=1 Tax=Acinetobacter higginsii TaxID=70347 RepID=N8XL20_9GAMM|nr:hypothetical protein [Acinetobacter higginsii]ENV07775.1 hypothetical protein F966_03632 [Acinetobacter higginsii]